MGRRGWARHSRRCRRPHGRTVGGRAEVGSLTLRSLLLCRCALCSCSIWPTKTSSTSCAARTNSWRAFTTMPSTRPSQPQVSEPRHWQPNRVDWLDRASARHSCVCCASLLTCPCLLVVFVWSSAGCAGSGVVLQPEDRYPELLEQYRTYTEQQIQVTTRREQRAIGCTRLTLCANRRDGDHEHSREAVRGDGGLTDGPHCWPLLCVVCSVFRFSALRSRSCWRTP